MKLALLKGNRFNPWHLRAFQMLDSIDEVTAFRADSEIQRYFREREGAPLDFATEPIYFDTQAGPMLSRLRNKLAGRFLRREARIVPFSERLKGFDVIQSWELFTDWSAEALAAKERYGIPLSVMVWDNIPFNMEPNPERREVKRRVAAMADRFIVHTERSLRMLDMEGVPMEKVVKIRPGVDTGRFAPGVGKREDFGLEEEDFVLLFVGWLLPRKGIDFLLLAMRELIHDGALRGKRVRLLMVGSGPGRERVETLIDRLGIREACHFAGALPYDRMPEVFHCADTFVLPSIATAEWQEQFGMSLIEAMACGVPVVSTQSGAIPEMAGDAAVLCQPNDFVSIYEAIKELILTPSRRAALSEMGRARAETEFSLARYARELSSLYGGMLRS